MPRSAEAAWVNAYHSLSSLDKENGTCIAQIIFKKWWPWNTMAHDVDRRVLKHPAWSLSRRRRGSHKEVVVRVEV